MNAKQDAIADIYAQVGAPRWARPNLDGLADVLRDLSWLPNGAVTIDVPELDGLSDGERETLLNVLARVMTESLESSHPVVVTGGTWSGPC